ncbi:putative DNA polymerase [Pseudomonas phage vB_PaeM_VL12]|uniref:DNA-directed DNA polymerase family A palm domain-containing protein n=4 Tax=Nankokuvirus G1 TaxID=2560662 RepID=A0A6G9LHN7_9CAUD|nr:hypothetical protein Epa24_00096 [Pseudomonas phage Epa24]QIQ64062.1 hypothetical protein Epa17_00061 [Pseudomonas phage Epa17]QIQ64954.1 hypothetical protein 16_00143 [Pseudomonas phage Epa16]QIQ65589.1 hypothetical protein 26_00075 [Pseudomonas phage Epa26]UKM53922.1 putative DNA polymerase [Pseudomonas phage vB_PaeM_VL12]
MEEVQKRRVVFDIEATGLIGEGTVDYTASPWRLKEDFKLHCAVARDIDTDEVFKWGPDEVMDFAKWLGEECSVVIGHNIINYDLLALKLTCGLEYTIGWGETKDTINGNPVKIVDTLVISKTLNPDRRPGHGIGAWGDKLGLAKIDWRAKAVELGLITENAPRGAEFKTYHPEMLEYNVRDVDVNLLVYKALMAEWGAWNWAPAVQTESYVAWVVTRQSHRGFFFDERLAQANVRELDQLMEECRAIVEPILPPKKPTKTEAAKYCFPKTQEKKIKGGLGLSSNMEKFLEKMGGKHLPRSGPDAPNYVEINGRTYGLPFDHTVSLLTEVPAKISDTTHIKGWLVDMGWDPTSWKERDLSSDQKTKAQLPFEKFEKVVTSYIEQTYASPFKKYRLEHLKEKLRAKWSLAFMMDNPDIVLEYILERGNDRQLKVWTNPEFTVGQDKDLCPALERISEKFPHVRHVTNYLTYRHRRNSILGGGYDPDDLDEDGMPVKGYMAYQREDGRIATPADSCGAGTSRFKHKQVANIPRVTSLYGVPMRNLFGVDTNKCWQIGYDFDSLEAKIEAHYCLSTAMRLSPAAAQKLKIKFGSNFAKYREACIQAAQEYAVALVAEKPNDIHTVTAAKISTIIGGDFSRTNAKSVKYGCSYGAQVARVAKIVGCSMQEAQAIFDAFWEAASPLALLKTVLTDFWKEKGNKKFIVGIDGRQIPTRSEHALVNSLFQSAGVICAKVAMIMHDQKLMAEGLLVDFWKDDWKNKSYCQQLIAYHDESQLEVTKDLVKFKMFSKEALGWQEMQHEDPEEQKKLQKKEDARCKALVQQWKDEMEESSGQIWSDIGESPKGGWFVGYSRAGETAIEAVKAAGEHFKLRVDLSAGYMLGTTWGTCH